jgi:hypothetical protein
LAVGERAGYELRSLVPVYNRVLRTAYWFRTSGLSASERTLRLARDAASRLSRRPGTPQAAISLKRVSTFGPEIGPIVERARTHAILTGRGADRLNFFLRFPRQAFAGWHLLDQAGRLRGFAVTNLVPKDQGQTRTGKIVDCLLDCTDVDLWHGATITLTRELARQGADLSQAYGSTPWSIEALHRSGYVSRYAVKFHIRDRLGLIPRDATFHLTPLEGDYAYT